MEQVKNEGLRFPKLERQELSRQLKEIRLLLGLQAKDVARELKIDPANFTRIEHGQLNYGVDTLITLADYYGFEIKVVLDASKVNQVDWSEIEDKKLAQECVNPLIHHV